jgi:hypothetical protein
MKSFLALLLATLGVAGCASYSVPAEAGGIRLTGLSSSTMEIHRPRFLHRDGTLTLEAYVMREFKGAVTPDSHVDIVYLDNGGRVLAEERANVRPQNLPETSRPPRPHAYFVQVIKPPTDTAAVAVRAHDVSHAR